MSTKLKEEDIQIKLNKEINDIRDKNFDLIHKKKSLKDLSYLKTYTIDDNETIEIDDAISLEKISDKYKLWIHIASPSTYIDYDSNFDRYARKQISTVYLSTSNIYMFPKILISDIFSLNKNKLNASLSLGVLFDNDGNINSSEIVQTLIKPSYKLSYTDADELIDFAPKEEEDLSIIYKILEKRKYLRNKNGAKEILESYGKIIVNKNIPSIKVIDPTYSRLLISEAMILYGDLIACYAKKNNIPVPYRVQESKNSLSKDMIFHSDNKILNNYLLKKSMGKSYYSLQPSRHDGLGLRNYLHATSPIRRYSDLLVHYQITRFIENKKLISNEEIQNNIIQINNLGRQNINMYREDQKAWLDKWFQNNNIKEYKVVFLNWVNRHKRICIVYFIDFNFTSICYLKGKSDIMAGDDFNIYNITNNYNDMLYFELQS